jgi:hypothetical protein
MLGFIDDIFNLFWSVFLRKSSERVRGSAPKTKFYLVKNKERIEGGGILQDYFLPGQ